MREQARSLFGLFCFEWKKQLLRPSIWGALILLTIVNSIQLDSVFQTNSLLSASNTDAKWGPIYRTLYDDFGGVITNETIERLMEMYRPLEMKTADLTASTRSDDPNTYTGNVYSDRLFFKWCFVAPMEYAYRYQNYAERVVEDARENQVFYRSIGNKYEAKKNAQLASLFDGRKVERFVYTEPYHYLFEYDASSIFVLLLVLYSLCGVFAFEKESGMNHLLPTVYHGGGRTMLAKLLSGFVFTTGINLWLFLSDLAGILGSFGTLQGGDSPLYALVAFENTPLCCSLWQYLLLVALLRLLGTWTIGLFVVVLSRLFQSTLLPLTLGTASTAGLLLLHYTYSGSAQLWLRAVNPFSLIYSREIFAKAEFVKLFGQPISLSQVAIVFSIVCIVGLSLFLLCPHGKKQRYPERRCHCETTLHGS